jgi:hypothetical protein
VVVLFDGSEIDPGAPSHKPASWGDFTSAIARQCAVHDREREPLADRARREVIPRRPSTADLRRRTVITVGPRARRTRGAHQPTTR